jgi:hypothetical protein
LQGLRFLRPIARASRASCVESIVAVDLFTLPTVRFQVLYVFVVLALERRRLVFANVTTNPTAFWLGQQTVNSFPWDTAPRFLIRDRDKAYGNEFSRRVRSLGIRSIKTAVRAPRMNCYAERLIGTIRRELFDHVIVTSESHARRLLREFQVWYNEDRLHLALEKDAPDHRPVEPPEMGEVISQPRLGGLHHRVEVSALSRFMSEKVGISLATFENLAPELGLRVTREAPVEAVPPHPTGKQGKEGPGSEARRRSQGRRLGGGFVIPLPFRSSRTIRRRGSGLLYLLHFLRGRGHVLSRLFVELRLAAWAAEDVGLPRMGALVRGFLVDAHFADRVFDHFEGLLSIH